MMTLLLYSDDLTVWPDCIDDIDDWYYYTEVLLWPVYWEKEKASDGSGGIVWYCVLLVLLLYSDDLLLLTYWWRIDDWWYGIDIDPWLCDMTRYYCDDIGGIIDLDLMMMIYCLLMTIVVLL